MKNNRLEELIVQSLEHEICGVAIYGTALRCVQNPDLKNEWERYASETRAHVGALEDVCAALGIDPKQETAGRAIVRQNGAALLAAMTLALEAGDATAAQLVACECVGLAETKDHLNWDLLGKCALHLPGAEGEVLGAAYAIIEDQEDEHLYRTKGWCRELWIHSLGMNAVLPPPEERQHVTTAIGAAKAKSASDIIRDERP